MATTLTRTNVGHDAHVAALELTERARGSAYTDLDGATPTSDTTMPDGTAKDTIAGMSRIAGVLRQLDVPSDVHVMARLSVSGSSSMTVSLHCKTLEHMVTCTASVGASDWDHDATHAHRETTIEGVEVQVWPTSPACSFRRATTSAPTRRASTRPSRASPTVTPNEAACLSRRERPGRHRHRR
jgi:hypothetical protein